MEIENKIAVVIGHTQNQQGACCPTGQIPCEWGFNLKLAEKVKSEYVDIYRYPKSGIGYINRVNEMAEVINSHNYKAVIELHYNAMGDPKFNGTEALYYLGSEKGKKYASLFCELFTEMYGFKNRGAKGLSTRKQRGFYFLQKIKAPAIILEPFFCTSPKDMEILKKYDNTYHDFLTYFIYNYILQEN